MEDEIETLELGQEDEEQGANPLNPAPQDEDAFEQEIALEDEEPEEIEEPAAAQPVEDEDDDPGLPPGLLKKLKGLRQKRDTFRTEAERLAQEKERLEIELSILKAEKEDPEPDPTDDPDEYKAWALRDAERRLRISKPAPAAAPAPGDNRIAEMRERVRQEYPDYDRFVSRAVLHKIDTDPALYDRVWGPGVKNPPLEAYKLGRELVLGEKPGQSSGGSGFAPATRRQELPGSNALVRKMARMAGVDEATILRDLKRSL